MTKRDGEVNMHNPIMSDHFLSRKPSAIRLAQIEFLKRTDGVEAVNTAIGNVSLPMHPAMRKRMIDLGSPESPFHNGVIKYSATIGRHETNRAFINIIASSGLEVEDLYSQITDGGSQAMELAILGVCGPAGSQKKPLLLIDPAYTNYIALAERLGRKTVSVRRTLEKSGKFTLPNLKMIEETIEKFAPSALVVIPYDNPTGHFCDLQTMTTLAKLCVKYNMWMISDEAYREILYTDQKISSIWAITDEEVPGIVGRRISIETSSKVWNACGLRIGALVTDNKSFNEKAVAENTAALCSNMIGQYIFGALAHETHLDLKKWYNSQREYYREMLMRFTKDMHKLIPGVIVSSPDASIYSVVDVREIAKEDFDAMDFVLYCARKGDVELEGKRYTLLVSPMTPFYNVKGGDDNPGKTQMRIAYVEVPEKMKLVPELFNKLFLEYEQSRDK